jgi:hypothetical protein
MHCRINNSENIMYNHIKFVNSNLEFISYNIAELCINEDFCQYFNELDQSINDFLNYINNCNSNENDFMNKFWDLQFLVNFSINKIDMVYNLDNNKNMKRIKYAIRLIEDLLIGVHTDDELKYALIEFKSN